MQRTYVIFSFVPHQHCLLVGPKCEYRTRCAKNTNLQLCAKPKNTIFVVPTCKYITRYASTQIFHFVPYHFLWGPSLNTFDRMSKECFKSPTLDPTKYIIVAVKGRNVNTFEKICKEYTLHQFWAPTFCCGTQF